MLNVNNIYIKNKYFNATLPIYVDGIWDSDGARVVEIKTEPLKVDDKGVIIIEDFWKKKHTGYIDRIAISYLGGTVEYYNYNLRMNQPYINDERQIVFENVDKHEAPNRIYIQLIKDGTL
jgi:hypothetical protein